MNLRYSGMAFASSVKEVKGEGNLPKLVLTSTHGRYVFVNCISLLLFVRHLTQIGIVFSRCCIWIWILRIPSLETEIMLSEFCIFNQQLELCIMGLEKLFLCSFFSNDLYLLNL